MGRCRKTLLLTAAPARDFCCLELFRIGCVLTVDLGNFGSKEQINEEPNTCERDVTRALPYSQ